MSPEQARGRAVDKRTDVWAFGAVLYEMLTRRRAFEGEDVTETMAAVMKSTPDWAALPADVPPHIVTLIQRCLEKDRSARVGDIAVARFLLSPKATAGASSPATAPRMTPLATTLVLLLAAAAVAAALLALRDRDAAPDLPAFRFEIATAPTDDPSTALSPDGTQIAFVANQDRVPVLWVRPLDSVESRPLGGTEGASFPFWSPDGRTLGFFAGDKLKRVEVAGGMPLEIADAPNGRGGAWNADGVILFVRGVSAPIMRVPARGGPVESVTEVNAGSGAAHRLPQFLPDGTRFLFTSALGGPDTTGVYVGSLDKTPPQRIVPGDSGGRFAAPDKLLTIRQGALHAYDFNAESATVASEPVVIAQGFSGASSISVFATSDTGVLAYRAGTAQRRQLVWVSRQGAMLRAIGQPETDFIASPELSGDEQSVVVFRQPMGDNDIWVIELARNLGRRVTDGQPADAHPLWDPDGQHVVFNSQRFGSGPTRQAVTGGRAEPLFTNGENGLVLSWTRDRRYALIRRDSIASGADLVAVGTGDQRPEVVVANSRYDETEGQFSPDGRWVAFASNESGRPEVFVQRFPEGQPRTQVSTAGGTQVRWSADGKEIYYVAPDGRMMAVAMAFNGTSPDVQLPVPLFQTHLATGTNVLGYKPQYAVSRDGRFLLNTAIESASAPIVVAVNWMNALAR
jgi:Tol biopolymer transport system component